MYRALRGIAPPSGPVMQGSVRYFTAPSKRTSTAWSIQCAIFLACYERMSKVSSMPVHRGWLLLAAFNSYLSLTAKLHEMTSVKRLDINQAYALLSYCGFLTMPSGAELQLRHCPNCSINYPVATKEAIDGQACPVCAINANCQRLSDQDCPSETANPTPQSQ